MAASVCSNVSRICSGVADIYESKKEDGVWGVLYKILKSEIANLDNQKGINKVDPKYQKIKIVVSSSTGGERYAAMSYAIVDTKRVRTTAGVKQVPPSPFYKRCIINGAKEQEFPEEYLKFLKSIPDNHNKYRRKTIGTVCD